MGKQLNGQADGLSRRAAAADADGVVVAKQLDFAFVTPIDHDGSLTRARRKRTKLGLAVISATRVNGFGIRSGARGPNLTPLPTVSPPAVLRRLLRNRIVELGITYATVDHVAGFPQRYTAKLLCEPPVRRLTMQTLLTLLDTLALVPAFQSNDIALDKLRRRHDWIPRQRNGRQYLPRDAVAS